MHTGTEEVQALALNMGRAANAVAMRLWNFASLDPESTQRGISGLGNVGRPCLAIWEEYTAHREEIIFESQMLWLHNMPEENDQEWKEVEEKLGIDKERWIKTRVNQSFFRQIVLSNYNFTCAVSGLQVPELLNASHIIPWATEPTMRLAPENGLCLSALYDRCFDRGLMTIDTNLMIRFSKHLAEQIPAEPYAHFFGKYEGQALNPPARYAPAPHALLYHNSSIFQNP